MSSGNRIQDVFGGSWDLVGREFISTILVPDKPSNRPDKLSSAFLFGVSVVGICGDMGGCLSIESPALDVKLHRNKKRTRN